MCEQCCAEADGFGEFLPGYYLCHANQDGHEMKKGDWGIVICNDPTFIFHTTPIKDPLKGMTDDQIDAMPDDEFSKFNVFLDTCYAVGKEMVDSRDSEFKWALFGDFGELYEAMQKAGFKPEEHGDAMVWLCNYIAEFLEKNPKPEHPYAGPHMVL